jgi:hypothetical protein
MPGINGTGNASIDIINAIANSSGIDEMYILVNNSIYEGYLFFILLWILWIILYVSAQKMQDQPLNNAMYASAILSILSLILRAITMESQGSYLGLINDLQMWVFPTITAVLSAIIWAVKRR